MREGYPQRDGSILCCCEERRSRRRTFTAKSVKTVLTLLTERGHNRLHSNWGKKTLRRSTPRRPGSSLLIANEGQTRRHQETQEAMEKLIGNYQDTVHLLFFISYYQY